MLVLYKALKNENGMTRIMQSEKINDLERRMSRSNDYTVLDPVTGATTYFLKGKKCKDD